MHEDCEAVRRRVSASLDGELSEFEHALVGDHLDGCPSCAAFAAGISGLTGELRRAPLEPFQRDVSVRRHPNPAWRRLAPMAAALAVIGVGLGSLMSTASLRLPIGAPAGDEPSGARSALVVNRLILSNLRHDVGRSRVPDLSKAPQPAGGKSLPTAPSQP